jgi:dephospho-CoA kinase
MLLVGLTGSIAMGKSTVAAMFRDLGAPVFDADAAVHEIYSGPTAALVEAVFPGVCVDGVVDRQRLGARVLGDAEAMKRLEAIVHPAVGEKRTAFLADARANGARAALLDVPLLFETGGDAKVDRVVVVSASPDLQRARALARPGMDAARFEALLARQTPDAEKRAKADFVIDTGVPLEATRDQVGAVWRALGQ